MTSSRFVLALLLLGCARPATPTVTVAAARPSAQVPVALGEPEEDFGCGVFAKDGPSEDALAFRACVEKSVAAETPCEGGGSPDLATLELAVALVDGAGGPADSARARKLLAGCFRDVAVEDVLSHADAKDADPKTAPLLSCDDYATTTFASGECLATRFQTERAWMRRVRREHGKDVAPLFDAATRASEEYAKAFGAIQYTRYVGGSIRNIVSLSQSIAELRRRRARLANARATAPRSPSPAAREAARALLVKTVAALADDQPDVAGAIRTEEKAFLAYREAETDFYERLHAGSRDAAAAELAIEHANALASMIEDR